MSKRMINEKKCIIFGVTPFAKMIRHYVEKYSDIKIVAYTVDRAYKSEDTFDTLPLVEFERVEQEYSTEEYSFLLALGYKGMNELRKQKYQAVKEKGYKLENFIHPSVVKDYLEIGEGNIILENVTLAYGVKIGNANIIWNGCQISHESIIGDFNFFSVSSLIAGKTVVKNNCFLGVNSAVHGARTLEDYTLIGAGCYMNSSSKAYGVYVPARSICLENKISTNML